MNVSVLYPALVSVLIKQKNNNINDMFLLLKNEPHISQKKEVNVFVRTYLA